MLTEREFAPIFEAAYQHQLVPIDLFVEAVVTTRSSSHFGRRVVTSTAEHSGMSLRCTANGNPRTITATGLDASKLLRQLQGKPTDSFLGETSTGLPSPTVIGKTELTQRLGKTNLSWQADYLEKRRRFWVARPGESVTAGNDEYGELDLQIAHCRKRIIRSALDEIVSWNKPDLLAHATQGQRWPFPNGIFPILWSSESVAKLLLPFLRAFEGDLVLTKRSFLSSGDFPCNFQLVDEKPRKHGLYDAEGSPRRELHFFDGKTPRLIPCDREIAQVIGLPPTGHSRRESFLTNQTIGLWNVRVVEAAHCDNLVAQVPHGVYVNDVEVFVADLQNPEVTVSLNDSCLIHQGEMGERLEPVIFKLGFSELLGSLKVFEKNQQTLGHRIEKKGQHFLMEITTGAAISEGLSLPGTVPLSHYWG